MNCPLTISCPDLRPQLTSRWNLSRVSFFCIWSWTQALAQYSPSSREDQQFPASLFVFIRMIRIRHLSSYENKKKGGISWQWFHVCITMCVCVKLKIHNPPSVQVASSATVVSSNFPCEHKNRDINKSMCVHEEIKWSRRLILKPHPLTRGTPNQLLVKANI